MPPMVSMAYVFELKKAGPPEEASTFSLDIVFSCLIGRKELQEITGTQVGRKEKQAPRGDNILFQEDFAGEMQEGMMMGI